MGRSYFLEWQSGYFAARDGAEKESNPYSIGTQEWRAWLNGWCDYNEPRTEQ